MEFANGATGTFVTTTGEFPGSNRFEISGDRGRVVMEHGKIVFDRTEVSVSEFNRTSPDSFPSIPTWRCEVPTGRSGAQHLDILRNFVAAILDGEPLLAPAVEGIHSVELANAMILSGLTNRTIELPMDSAEYAAELDKLIASSRSKKEVKDNGPTDLSGTYNAP
jgi:predicted dehydrogenase